MAEETITEAERERVFASLAALKVTLTRPGWGFRQASNMDVVPWEAIVGVLGGEEPPAGDAGALARVRKLAETWSALPPDTAAALTLRHAGAELLGRIDGGGEGAGQ